MGCCLGSATPIVDQDERKMTEKESEEIDQCLLSIFNRKEVKSSKQVGCSVEKWRV